MHSKIIHYCWFGGELPDHQKAYIEEWESKFPDYEIIHWNENNIPRGGDYIERVLKTKNWAFLSDYVRLYALYKYGGIYFDTDIRVVNNFEHELTNDTDCLFGFESNESSNKHYIGTAVIVAQKNSPIIEEFLSKYNNRYGKMIARNDLITGPMLITKIMEKRGLISATTQSLGSARLLNQKLMYPSASDDLKNCYTIHDEEGSWCSAEKKRSLLDRLYRKKRKLIDKFSKLTNVIA